MHAALLDRTRAATTVLWQTDGADPDGGRPHVMQIWELIVPSVVWGLELMLVAVLRHYKETRTLGHELASMLHETLQALSELCMAYDLVRTPEFDEGLHLFLATAHGALECARSFKGAKADWRWRSMVADVVSTVVMTAAPTTLTPRNASAAAALLGALLPANILRALLVGVDTVDELEVVAACLARLGMAHGKAFNDALAGALRVRQELRASPDRFLKWAAFSTVSKEVQKGAWTPVHVDDVWRAFDDMKEQLARLCASKQPSYLESMLLH